MWGSGFVHKTNKQGEVMSQIVKCGLIQCSNPINDESVPVAEIQQAMLEKHLKYIDEAGEKGVRTI